MNNPLKPFSFSLRQAFRVWQREVSVYKYVYKSTIISNLMDPLIYLMALGFGLGAYVNRMQGLPYIQFIAPGLISSSIMTAATFETTINTFVRIHFDRIYEAMMATPVTVEDIAVGEMMWAMTRSTIYATVMLGVVTVLGLTRSWYAIFVPLMGALGGLMFATLGLTYTSFLKSIDQVNFYMTLFITPLFLFSGVFYPIDALPQIVKTIAFLSPLYHLVEVVRPLVLGTVGYGILIHLGWILAFVFIFTVLPVNLLRRKLVK
jgi:lipooligosaccharide transport system permease protein